MQNKNFISKIILILFISIISWSPEISYSQEEDIKSLIQVLESPVDFTKYKEDENLSLDKSVAKTSMDERFAKANELRRIFESKSMALKKLGETGDPSAVEPIMSFLINSDPMVQSSLGHIAAEALAKIGEPAITQLIGALKNKTQVVRHYSLYALEKIGEPAIEPLIDSLSDKKTHDTIKKDIAELLGKIGGKRAVKPLVDILDKVDGKACKTVMDALVKIGEPAVEPLIVNLQSGNEEKILPSLYVLGVIGNISGDTRAFDYIVPLLKADSFNVRYSAALALGSLKDVRAIEHIVPMLKDENEKMKFAIISSLWTIRDNRVIEPLIGVLKEENEKLRERASEALSQITGEKNGTDYNKWNNWFNVNKDNLIK